MHSMFYGWNNLREINLSSFNTQNVTDMEYMFYGCNNLREINLSSFNTQNFTEMGYMFSYCRKLEKIDLSSFNNQNINVTNMFVGCKNIGRVILKIEESKIKGCLKPDKFICV